MYSMRMRTMDIDLVSDHENPNFFSVTFEGTHNLLLVQIISITMTDCTCQEYFWGV